MGSYKWLSLLFTAFGYISSTTQYTMSKPLFIAFEGIDGSGKSTQINFLQNKLMAKGYRVYATAEPTKSPIGKLIRDIFSHKTEADHPVIAGLFVADRLHHLLDKNEGILKLLNEGYTVLTDRYYFSSYAYHGTHMDMDWVIQSNAFSAKLKRPDLNIFIDVSPEVCMERIRKGRTNMELYETLDNLHKVRQKYLEAFDKLKNEEKILVINGNQTPEQVADAVWKEVNKRLVI